MKGRKPEIRAAGAPQWVAADAPDWLADDARAEWDRVMPDLTERRILTDADLVKLTGRTVVWPESAIVECLESRPIPDSTIICRSPGVPQRRSIPSGSIRKTS